MSGKHTMPVSETNRAALDAIQDEEIDTSDIPPIPLDQFANALIRKGFKLISKKLNRTKLYHPRDFPLPVKT
ncbi:MAG: hypothetical protein G8345_15010 [Magnetococcales bacterium]|nr:hypothetical protein [Magnetococcales bacterium]NGZ28188.1 hypothetical protein [Magnetococcales bacterium]